MARRKAKQVELTEADDLLVRWRRVPIAGKVRSFDCRLADDGGNHYLVRIDRVSEDRVYRVSVEGWDRLARDLQRMADGEPTAAGHETQRGIARAMFYALKEVGFKFVEVLPG
ncbi:MAG: hypothetical protein ACYTFI_28750 [Planctomycetota bacterium]|jgi:hypothetical protein